MNVGGVIIITFFVLVLAVVAVLALKLVNDNNDIAQQIIREHEEEIKRFRQNRYE